MLYKIVWVLARIAFKAYFRKIHLVDKHKIPRKGPLLMAVNHPSSFMEPCVLATFQPRSLYFLTRGDVFKKKWAAFFLRGTHQIPIFRARDGFENLRKNEGSFKACHDALKQNKTIIIFPESRTIWEKRIRPMQKGAAKLAFGTKQKHKEIDLKILPVGVNFEDPRKFQSDVIIRFGDPISVNDYWENYQVNDRAAVSTLTNEIKNQFEKLVFNLPTAKHQAAFSAFDLIYKNEFDAPNFPEVIHHPRRFDDEMEISKKVAKLDENNAFISLANEYSETLKNNKWDDRLIAMYNGKNKNWFGFAIAIIPWIIGRYSIGLVGYISSSLINKKVKDDAFVGPVKVGAGIVLYFIITIILSFLLFMMFRWWGIFALILFLSIGYYTARLSPFVTNSLALLFQSKKFKNQILQLTKMRQDLVTQLSLFHIKASKNG